MIKDDFELNLKLFKSKVKNSIDILFLDFIKIFENFDLKYKPLFIN